MTTSSTPNLRQFKPLKHQYEVIYDVRKTFDYSLGVHEFLLSGAVGSAKSLTLAHLVATHCISYPGAIAGLGRLALPRLKETLCMKIREHLFEVGAGLEYRYNETTGNFQFNNGSKMIAFSWADKNYQKFRSYELSCMAFEELSENKGDHKSAYMEAYQRVGRLTHVPEAWVGAASNPDSPSHWAYEHFMQNASPQRKVYYSVTRDNPYLPESYVDNLMLTLDEKEIRRMVYGEWIEISSEVVYHAYDRERNFKNESYTVMPRYPVCVAFDFNIALGKPLSIAFIQHIKGQTHCFGEVTVEGLRTRDALEEAWSRGLLPPEHRYIIHGDQTGKHSDTRGNEHDYIIIERFFQEMGLDYEMDIPTKNPPIKKRHALVNGRICNAHGRCNLFVYKDAPMTDKGLRLTSLKKGSQYVEDDKPDYQHITTAVGYSICAQIDKESYGSYRGAAVIGR